MSRENDGIITYKNIFPIPFPLALYVNVKEEKGYNPFSCFHFQLTLHRPELIFHRIKLLPINTNK